MQFELSPAFLELTKDAIEARDESFLVGSLSGVNPADLKLLLDEFNGTDCKYVMDLLETEVSADIIELLETDVRIPFLDNYSAEELLPFLDTMDSDDAVDILNELPLTFRKEIIGKIDDPERKDHILDLLRYEEDTAGGLMAKELIKANLHWTVKQCIQEIRRQTENVDKIYTVYVVDDFDQLLGRVSLKDIILAKDETKISDLYLDDIISVDTFLDEEEVAQVMERYDLDTVPVVNVRGKLVGRITIDDVVDVIMESAEEERQLMSGIAQDVEEDDSIWLLTKARLPWLVVGLVGGMFAAVVMKSFMSDLEATPKWIPLLFFIPLIMASGGNAGIQSTTIVIQSLAKKSVFEDKLVARLLKVFFVGLLNGLILATLMSLAIAGLNQVFELGWATEIMFVVPAALLGVVILATILGTLIPIVMDNVGVNPALAAGPLITTTNDLLALVVYFIIAGFLLP